MDARSIFIVVVILILLYYIVSTFLTSSGLTKVMGADQETTISSNKMKGGATVNSSYSIWIFVDDWSENYGKEKVVFKRLDQNNNGLKVHLGSHTNDIIVYASHKGDGSSSSNDNTKSAGEYPGGWPPASGAATCDGGETSVQHTCAGNDKKNETYSVYVDGKGQPYKDADGNHYPVINGRIESCTDKQNIPNYVDPTTYCSTGTGTKTSTFTTMKQAEGFNIFGNKVTEGMTDTEEHKCIVRNVPLQKWVNIIVSFNNTTLDIYMNGKLVKTCIMPNTLEMKGGDASAIITPNGDSFSGKTSKFKFWSTPMDPQKAWYTYSDGFAPGLGLANFFSKYSVRMALLENNVETTSVTI